MSTIAAVLAAGAGSRFIGAGHKLNQLISGQPIAARSVSAAVAADIGEVIVITGATRLDALPGDVVVLDNPDWSEGQATSLRLAVEHASSVGADAVVIGLGDQPFITPDIWAAVARCDAPIAVATFDGHRRNPVRLAASVWSLLPTEGDHGARDLIRLRPDLVEEVPCQGVPTDIDTWEELQLWRNKSSTNSR